MSVLNDFYCPIGKSLLGQSISLLGLSMADEEMNCEIWRSLQDIPRVHVYPGHNRC